MSLAVSSIFPFKLASSHQPGGGNLDIHICEHLTGSASKRDWFLLPGLSSISPRAFPGSPGFQLGEVSLNFLPHPRREGWRRGSEISKDRNVLEKNTCGFL